MHNKKTDIQTNSAQQHSFPGEYDSALAITVFDAVYLGGLSSSLSELACKSIMTSDELPIIGYYVFLILFVPVLISLIIRSRNILLRISYIGTIVCLVMINDLFKGLEATHLIFAKILILTAVLPCLLFYLRKNR